MATFPEELFLAKIKRLDEALALLRTEFGDWRSLTDKATADARKTVEGIASVLRRQDGTIAASAISGKIRMTQVEEGFAKASDIDLVQAKLVEATGDILAEVQEIRDAQASSSESVAQDILTITAQFKTNKAQVEEKIVTVSDATSAMAQQVTTIEATVQGLTDGLATTNASITNLSTATANSLEAIGQTIASLTSSMVDQASGVEQNSATIEEVRTVATNAAGSVATLSTTLTSTYSTKTYTDGKASDAQTAATNAAKLYTDGQVTTLNASISTAQTTATNAANSVASLSTNVSSNYSTKTYADGKASDAQTAATNAAKLYTDGQVTTLNASIGTAQTTATNAANSVATLSTNVTTNYSTKTYADGKASDAQNAAKLYTDGQVITLTSSITNEATARSTADESVATTMSRLLSTMGDVHAAVQVLSDAYIDSSGNAVAKYALTVTAGGVVTGFEATSQNGPAPVSSFKISADSFKIVAATAERTPFIIDAVDGMLTFELDRIYLRPPGYTDSTGAVTLTPYGLHCFSTTGGFDVSKTSIRAWNPSPQSAELRPGSVFINGFQVLGPRMAAIANSGNATTDAILNVMRTMGLIETSAMTYVATPAFTKINLPNEVDVVINTNTSGATIYWRQEGTTSWNSYATNQYIPAPLGTNIQAYATKSGYLDSAISTFYGTNS